MFLLIIHYLDSSERLHSDNATMKHFLNQTCIPVKEYTLIQPLVKCV